MLFSPNTFEFLYKELKLTHKNLTASDSYALRRTIFQRMCDWCFLTISNDIKCDFIADRAHFMARFQKMEFVTLRLTADDAKNIEKYAQSKEGDYTTVLHEILASGHKVSISWIDDKSSYIVTLIGTEHSQHNQGYSMTTWSDDLVEAIFMAGYKHEIVCDGGSWQDNSTGDMNWG